MKLGNHMIVRKEKENIVKCLDSCIGLVDFTAVAVDAGKESDETYELIKDRENTFVYRQEWKDSFAEARNDVLYNLIRECPDLDYICWIDADDVWGDEKTSVSHEVIRQRLEQQNPITVNNTYIYGEDLASNNSSLSYLRLRVFAHEHHQLPLYLWEGAAHESLVQHRISGIQRPAVSWTDWVLVHNRTANIDWFAKTGRNIFMLEKEIKEKPDNPRTIFYLAREYRDHRDVEKSIVTFNKYLNKSNFILEKYQALLDLIDLYQINNDVEMAKRSAKQAIDLMPEIAFAPCMLGDIYMKENRPDIARMYYSMATLAPHGQVLFDYLPYRTYIPHKSMSLACIYSGMLEEGIKHHEISKKIAPNDIGIKYNDPWLINNSKEFPEEFSWMTCYDEDYIRKQYQKRSTSDKFIPIVSIEDWFLNSTVFPNYVHIIGNDIDFKEIISSSTNDSKFTKIIFINETLTLELLNSCKNIFVDRSPVAIFVKDFGDWKLKTIVAKYLSENSSIELYRNFELNLINPNADKKEGLGILIRKSP